MMRNNTWLAGFLSLVVPGLGQVYAGDSFRGGMIIAASIVIGNLNIIILPLIAIANPVIPADAADQTSFWTYWIPRIMHDILSFWSIVFWGWVVYDAVAITRKKVCLENEN
jgi:hypothetical protein